MFLLGVFFIFGIIGSAVDTMDVGLQSPTRYLVGVVLAGVFAILIYVRSFCSVDGAAGGNSSSSSQLRRWS